MITKKIILVFVLHVTILTILTLFTYLFLNSWKLFALFININQRFLYPFNNRVMRLTLLYTSSPNPSTCGRNSKKGPLSRGPKRYPFRAEHPRIVNTPVSRFFGTTVQIYKRHICAGLISIWCAYKCAFYCQIIAFFCGRI